MRPTMRPRRTPELVDARRALAPSSVLALCCVLTACGGGGGSASGSGPSQNPGGGPPPVQPTHIELLAVMTTSAAALYADPHARVQHLVDVANDILDENATEMRFDLARTVTVDYPDAADAPTALDAITSATDPAFVGVAAARDASRADLVVLLRPYVGDGYCGYAWVGGAGAGGDFAANPAEPSYAFSVVAVNCSDYTLLHETGHNMGLVHSRRENPAGGSLPYGAGYGIDNVFVTVMASPGAFNAPQLPALSNASRDCLGHPCGISYLDPVSGAEDARALHEVRTQIAAYR